MEKERNLMTTEEAAIYLGVKRSCLYKLMMRRAIPYYKPNGKLYYFDKEDLDAWQKNIRVKSQTEIESEASELGIGRNLMVTKLENTWKKLHADSTVKTTPNQPVVSKPTLVHAQETALTARYTDCLVGTIPYRINMDGGKASETLFPKM